MPVNAQATIIAKMEGTRTFCTCFNRENSGKQGHWSIIIKDNLFTEKTFKYLIKI